MKKTFVVIAALALVWIFAHQMLSRQGALNADLHKVQQEASVVERKITNEMSDIKESKSDKLVGAFLRSDFEFSKYPKETQVKIKTLGEILASKNDNDPRIDSDFKGLTDQDKVAFKEFYKALKPESLNERGTLTYLMGRSIQGAEDLDFMKDILAEEPCMSLENCANRNVAKDTHLDSMDETTLSYPQLMALESISRFTQAHIIPELSSGDQLHLIEAIREAQRSPIPSVARKANELSRNLRL